MLLLLVVFTILPSRDCIYWPTIGFALNQILFSAEMTGLRRLEGIGGNSSTGHASPHSQLELSVRHHVSPSYGPGAASTAAASTPNNSRASNVSCKYVIAADGAGSSVRAAAGLCLSGRRDLGHVVNIHFRCEGLGQILLGEGEGGKRQRPGMLYFVYNEVNAGVREGAKGGGLVARRSSGRLNCSFLCCREGHERRVQGIFVSSLATSPWRCNSLVWGCTVARVVGGLRLSRDEAGRQASRSMNLGWP